jgi:hypothetical protein
MRSCSLKVIAESPTKTDVRLAGAIVATGCGDFIKLKTLGAGSRSGERP